jgi:hypothetical protein
VAATAVASSLKNSFTVCWRVVCRVGSRYLPRDDGDWSPKSAVCDRCAVNDFHGVLSISFVFLKANAKMSIAHFCAHGSPDAPKTFFIFGQCFRSQRTPRFQIDDAGHKIDCCARGVFVRKSSFCIYCCLGLKIQTSFGPSDGRALLHVCVLRF